MRPTNKIILIAEGDSVPGFYIAKLLSDQGHKVILTGRNEQQLKDAASRLHNADYFAADPAKEEDLEDLAAFISFDYRRLDVLVNHITGTDTLKPVTDADDSLTGRFLPIIERQQGAVVMHINAQTFLSSGFS